ncbi:hypothetical protein Pla123a_39460 [Posidoniimonas polymericola]|uniref:3-keto-alpha-glucoside-1,2-lyase/3-keto-2-hydroxy-glucal hydratase domain-containing protein n=1 Tax=Posidoniimonas polymericola TaxID=2528002 RepID=A0A5C5YFA7_9BACT|nr:DUF1080 domain-containing protein [Posidoniimonas polymericola]TWT73609.1 hypothetical protein Pla123a_39460 [Posidoniimonas polymericola]
MLRTSAVAGLSLALAFTSAVLADHHLDGESESGAVISLFDGTSLDAWKGYKTPGPPKGWVIEDGVLVHRSGGVDLVTKETFSDFELAFEWKIAAGGNSGVIYRCDETEDAPYMTGPEFQVLDNESWGIDPFDPHAAGSLYGLFSVSEKVVKPAGEWNTAKIVVHDGVVEHWVNGKQVVKAEIGGDKWNELVSSTKFNAWKRFGKLSEGHISLQAHNGQDGDVEPVWFRDITIRRLGDK